MFAALGTVVAELVGAGGVRFFENGVVSLNLPVAEEELRARASRTTHPMTLSLLAKLLGVVGRELRIDNPFLLKTKAEVARVMQVPGHADLIGHSVSCARTIFMTKDQAHCGACSQCIDRRVGVLAAGLGDYDPTADYVSEVFAGPRGADRTKQNMAVDYVRHAVELHSMHEADIAARFNAELTRAARPLGPNTADWVRQLVDLYKRHGRTVYGVVAEQLQRHAGDSLLGQVDPTSMLGLVQLNKHREPRWRR